MQQSLALSVGLPLVLCVIMLGLGLSLRLDDFARVIRNPKPLAIGLACQIVVLPAFCLALVALSDLPPAIAVGMMLLAASPGGTSATLYTHLARGDVALCIAMVAVNSLLAMVSLPIIANLSLEIFYGASVEVYLEARQVLLLFTIAIVPAMIGALISHRHPAIALRMERPVKLLATLFLAGVVVVALVGQWHLVAVWGLVVAAAVIVFNVASLGAGYALPRLFGVERRQAIALAMAIGIHNAALVITLALSEAMLDNPEMAIPPAAYGLFAYVTAGVFVWLLNRRGETAT